MPSLEFEDKSIDRAIKKACEKLNVQKDKLKYNVISYGSSGIFGLVGSRKAKISVDVPEPEPVNDIETDMPEKEVEEKTDTTINVAEDDEHVDNDSIADEAIELGKNALKRIVDSITTDADISVDQDDMKMFLFNIKGGNSGILIGKHGQTLEAIQYIVEKIINKKSKKRIRIQIDVEEYIQTRQKNLKALSERLAEKAKRTGKPATINQMNSNDRRFVHLTLKEDSAVRTQSMGSGYYRKLVIYPKSSASRKKNNRHG